MDELLGRRVPWSAEAEQAVLGSCLIDPACLPEVLTAVRTADFYLEQNRDIFDTIFHMFTFGMAIDPVTVLDQMKVRGVYNADSSSDYIRELMRMTPTAANVLRYAAIVRDQALLRNVIQVCEETVESASSGGGEAGDVLDLVEKKIYALRQDRTVGGLLPVSQVVQTVYADLSELAASGRPIPGIPTGFVDVDRRILGLNPGDFVLIAARPGMGKTTLALNIMMNVAKTTKKTVAFFSLEMSREQLASRLLSCESSVDSYRLSTGKLEPEDWEKIGVASAALAQTDIRVSDNPTITVTEMNALCRRLDNLGLIIVDYLQLMTRADKDSRSAENRVNVVAEISRALKIMAKDLNVPVICLSQLSRAAEGRTDKRPLLSDLRESGAIEQDADQVIMLYRDDYYNPNTAERNICECIVAKNRRGEPGTVKVQWMPQFFSFSDLDTVHGE